MVISNSLGNKALDCALDAAVNTSYTSKSNLEEKFTEGKDVEQVTSYLNMKYTDNTILLLDYQKISEVSRETRIQFLD